MTQDSYSKFYDSEYRRLYVGTKNAEGFFFEDRMFRGQRIYNYVNSKINLSEKKLKVVEIGCGAGGILEVFRSKGHEVLGFDLGDEYLNYGKDKYNLNLKKGEITNLEADFKPDLIIYSHVFEHMLDINNEISLIKDKLVEKGLVYIEVPGLNYIHSTYDMNFLKFLQNAHTYHFTKKSLTTIFENNGFVKVSADDQIRSLFAVSDKDISQQEFISEYSDVLKYLKKTERFRFFNFLRFKKLKWKIKKYLIKIAR
ncbi:MAG: class I SAM-dependent methyltransferase [Bacteroidales bacterium]|nr:class I SAM-dependent methyltransferase [Bacteroidales bacterium]